MKVRSASEARESGFYWVMSGHDWTIAQWNEKSGWISVLGETEFNRTDVDFDEIDERRIERST